MTGGDTEPRTVNVGVPNSVMVKKNSYNRPWAFLFYSTIKVCIGLVSVEEGRSDQTQW